jgi:hypothetical protein
MDHSFPSFLFFSGGRDGAHLHLGRAAVNSYMAVLYLRPAAHSQVFFSFLFSCLYFVSFFLFIFSKNLHFFIKIDL